DVNHFHAAGGTGLLFRELLDNGLMHGDARSVWGASIADYTREPALEGGALGWRPGAGACLDPTVRTGVAEPFDMEGGLRLIQGNLGRGVIKISAVADEHRVVAAPAVVVASQEAMKAKFDAGELDRDCVVVVRFQGPRANGMPELHKLTPYLGVLQDLGFKVALVTDGRMSGAAGKVPAAIHVSAEGAAGGPVGKLRDGDWIAVGAHSGLLECRVAEGELSARPPAVAEEDSAAGVGRELFANFRRIVSPAEQGAS